MRISILILVAFNALVFAQTPVTLLRCLDAVDSVAGLTPNAGFLSERLAGGTVSFVITRRGTTPGLYLISENSASFYPFPPPESNESDRKSYAIKVRYGVKKNDPIIFRAEWHPYDREYPFEFESYDSYNSWAKEFGVKSVMNIPEVRPIAITYNEAANALREVAEKSIPALPELYESYQMPDPDDRTGPTRLRFFLEKVVRGGDQRPGALNQQSDDLQVLRELILERLETCSGVPSLKELVTREMAKLQTTVAPSLQQRPQAEQTH